MQDIIIMHVIYLVINICQCCKSKLELELDHHWIIYRKIDFYSVPL